MTIETIYQTASIIITVSAVSVFSAVIFNFISCSRKDGVKRERRSIIATASMTGFFILLYVLIHNKTGSLQVDNIRARLIMAAIGLSMVVTGTIVNLLGRLKLGRNWANQATIYRDQGLIVSGVYSIVRHPLYASLIWMFYGAAIVYANASAFLAVTLVFLPFMYYRARLEEAMLKQEFAEYSDYMRNVGMFFYKPSLMHNNRRQEMASEQCSLDDKVAVSNAAFIFCRYSMTLLIWAAFFLKIKLLVAILFALLALSAALSIQFAPLMWLYSMTINRLLPSKEVMLSRSGMRVAHSIGTIFAGLCLVFLYFINEKVGWSMTLVYCVIKTFSAIWACPVYKLYTCMKSGNCCTFLNKYRSSQPPASETSADDQS